MKRSEKILPLAIIGGGPAGVTAAIYAKRSNIAPVIFTKEVIGGKAAKTLIIENYPGISSMNGLEFCDRLEKQVAYLKIEVKKEAVIAIKQIENDLFELKTPNANYVFEKIIIATGARERKHPGKKMLDFEGKGVSYCSSCDGYFFKNQTIGVIGGGNAAVEESKVLAQIGKEVIIFNRDQKFIAEPSLIDEIKQLPNVSVQYQTNVLECLGKDLLTGIIVENSVTKVKREVKLQGLFVFIGSIANSQFLNPEWPIYDNQGYLKVDHNFETKITNLYAVGDIVSGQFQQYTTAVGSATIALKDIINKGYRYAK